MDVTSGWCLRSSRRLTRTSLITVFALVVVLLWAPPPASACSCVPRSADRMLADSQAAFVGRLAEIQPDRRHTVTFGSDAAEGLEYIAYIFEVQTVLAGQLPGKLAVFSAEQEPACGFGLQPGDTAGVVLRREAGVWVSGLCGTANPDALTTAGSPHPPTAAAASSRGEGSGVVNWWPAAVVLGVAAAGVVAVAGRRWRNGVDG